MRDWLLEHKLIDHADLNRWAVLADSQFEMVKDILCRRVQLSLAGKVDSRQACTSSAQTAAVEGGNFGTLASVHMRVFTGRLSGSDSAFGGPVIILTSNVW